MSHKREIQHYEGALPKLGEVAGQLTFDQLSALLRSIAAELGRQALADAARGRPRLAGELAGATAALQTAVDHIDEAWCISAPHMTPQERGEE